MMWPLRILGVLLALMGAVWCLQGIGVMPGSAMSGSQFWAVAGVVVLVLGVALIAVSGRMARR